MDLSLPIRGVRRTISLVAVVVLTASTLCTSVAGRAHATPGGSAPHRAAAPYFTITAGDALGPGLPTDGWAVIGHFASPELDDIIWYRPGAGKELRSTPCRGCQAGPFTTSKLSQQVTGSYQPVVGDFAGDGLDDILWWADPASNPDTALDYLWVNDGSGGFTSKAVDVAAGWWEPIVLPDRGPGKDDILWRARHRSSPLWVFPDDATGNARTAARLRTPPGQPVVGDFDGNGLADVLFYDVCDFMLCGDAGAPPDALWRRTSGTTGAFTMTSLDVRGTYHPIVGRFSRAGDARDDILWVGYEPQYRSQPLDGPDHLWEGRADGRFTSSNESFPGAPLPIELGHAGGDRVLLLGLFGDGTTAWHDTATGSGLEPTNADDGFHLVSGFTQLATGRFTNPDRDDLLIDDVVLLHPTS